MDSQQTARDNLRSALSDAIAYCDAAMHPSEQYADDRGRLISVLGQYDAMRDSAAPMFGYPVADWHRHFAWYPVDTLDQGWKWLRFVERRRIHKHQYLDGPEMRWWQYRANPSPSHQPARETE